MRSLLIPLLALILAVAFLAGRAMNPAPARASGQDSWTQNGVVCWPTGTGTSRGVACQLRGSRKLAIVNHRSIIVGSRGHVVYVTSSR